MGAENRPFATDKGQSVSYFCDTPMTIRKLSDDLIQIKEQKLPTCFSELFFGDGSSPDQTLRPPMAGGLFFCPNQHDHRATKQASCSFGTVAAGSGDCYAGMGAL
jgi:hypothetical protein